MKKRVLSLILLMVMAVSAFGCGKVNVNLGTYDGMVLTKVTDKQIEETISSLLKENAGCMEVDREAAKDDTVNMDYEGIYYGDISITFKFELEKDYNEYSFVPGTLNGTEFTPLYTAEANNLVKLEPSATAASGSNHYLNENGAIVVSNKEATSLTLAIKADFVKEIVEKKLSFTAKTNGVKITSMKVLAVSAASDKEYKGDESYVGDGNLISSVSYEAFSNVYGVAFSGGKAEKQDLVLGSGSFIPGFEDQLIGHKAGEKVMVKLSFPDPYQNNTRLAGQPVIFNVTINAVKEDPKFDDAFAKYMEQENAEAYRQYIIDTMNNNYFEEQISDKLLEICTVKNLPKKEVKEYKENVTNYYTTMAEYYAKYYSSMGYSMTTDAVLSNFFGFKSTEELEKFAEEYANNYLSMMYITKEIASKENITVSDKDYEDTAMDYAENNGYESINKFFEENAKTDADKQEIVDEINYIALLGNVLDHIKSTAVIKEADNTTTDKEDK